MVPVMPRNDSVWSCNMCGVKARYFGSCLPYLCTRNVALEYDARQTGDNGHHIEGTKKRIHIRH